jgi:hypothetical protein
MPAWQALPPALSGPAPGRAPKRRDSRYRSGRSLTWLKIKNPAKPPSVVMMISLSFLAPDLVMAAMHGRLPRGIGVTRLIDAPIEWSRQRYMLGL